VWKLRFALLPPLVGRRDPLGRRRPSPSRIATWRVSARGAFEREVMYIGHLDAPKVSETNGATRFEGHARYLLFPQCRTLSPVQRCPRRPWTHGRDESSVVAFRVRVFLVLRHRRALLRSRKPRTEVPSEAFIRESPKSQASRARRVRRYFLLSVMRRPRALPRVMRRSGRNFCFPPDVTADRPASTFSSRTSRRKWAIFAFEICGAIHTIEILPSG